LAGAFSQTPQALTREGKEFIANLGQFTNALNAQIKHQLHSKVRDLDREIGGLINIGNRLADQVGIDAANPEVFIRRVFDKSGGPSYQLLKEYDRAFGTKFFPLARESRVGAAFQPVEIGRGEYGLPSNVPKIAAGAGLPVGMTSLVGATVGGAVGGVPGMLVGGAAGMLANPANIVRVAPGLAKGGAAVGRAAGRVSQYQPGGLARAGVTGGRIAAQQSAGSAYGRYVADQDKKKNRRAYFLGG
jgi:hypothetical protein